MKDYEQLYYDLKFENKKLKEKNKMLEEIIETFKSINNNNKLLLTILALSRKMIKEVQNDN